ncbi:hypothetical protein [Pengzhenrongella frigida]|uniref:Uncharacterized protein n=1 Tax=Pengzhenrongella frigida TaxID=1259133 RepID=A0A4V1ZHH4_9MICO|nr:hypothetical protein [Cellulomonas sp. HLT2-17]RYV52054.1 hypothetical protein EUA98_05670 [Cellulomonas sp. HLT2-17]
MTEPREIPALHEISPWGRQIVLAHIESERASALALGIAIGRQEVYDAWHQTAVVSAAVAQMIANTPSYAELCRRRGEPELAARQLATLSANGVTS